MRPIQIRHRIVDYYGMGFLLEQTHALTGTDGIALGSSEFDTKRPPIVIKAYPFQGKWILPRVISTLSPIPLLSIALLFFPPL